MCPDLGSDYDLSNIEPATPREPLPAGWYGMQAVSNEVRPSKEGGSHYLWMEFETLEHVHPQFKGRKVWARLNLWNSNQEAVQIAQRELAAIGKAVGEMRIRNSDILLHKPIAVKVKLRPADGQYEAQNDISGFDSFAARFPQGGGAPAPGPGYTPPPAQQAPGRAPVAPTGMPPAGSKPPWQK